MLIIHKDNQKINFPYNKLTETFHDLKGFNSREISMPFESRDQIEVVSTDTISIS